MVYRLDPRPPAGLSHRHAPGVCKRWREIVRALFSSIGHQTIKTMEEFPTGHLPWK